MLHFVRRPKLCYLILSTLVLFGVVLLFYSSQTINLTKRTSIGNVVSTEIVKFDLEDGTTRKEKIFLSKTAHCHTPSVLSDVDISTTYLYPKLNFQPRSRTYWNYTFEKRYLKTRDQWNKIPLKVIVVPHSHNDPGWLLTFDDYFYTYTARILNNMVEKLNLHSDLSFVWTEISFFSKWWTSLKNRPHLRDAVKELVTNGQLEMVTGGWVMTDEASSSYYAMIDQLIEGHNWLKTTLNIEPTHAWSVDPFGHSSTFAYILKSSGIHNMLIQRTHYAWKQYLAEQQQLNFWWMQPFDRINSSRILCQMAPFDLYNIKYTCGPDTEVCLQFDFRRIAGEYTDSRSVPITNQNVEEKAELLLSQYGRTASLFRHNVALVKLGDDFRFKHEAEWDQQYNNYKKLFQYINSRKDWNAEVRFGTVKDYFDEVHRRMKDINGDSYPSLVGDFFAYGDIYATGKAAYWTGYYTTRPYWKQLCRELEYWLRNTEILYSLSRVVLRHGNHSGIIRKLDEDYNALGAARESLALFQHHDAITGTSKEAVMHDYGLRLFHGIQQSITLLSYCSQYVLLKIPKTIYHRSFPYLVVDFTKPTYDVLPTKSILKMSREGIKKVVVFNSLPHRSQQAIRVRIGTPNIAVYDSSDRKVSFQINPIWNETVEILSDAFEVVFVAHLPPLSLETFVLRTIDKMIANKTSINVVVNDAKAAKNQDSIFTFHNLIEENIIMESPHIFATFSRFTGFLQSIDLKRLSLSNQAKMDFQAYRSEEFSSGAYLFQPSFLQPLRNITGRFPIIRVIRGSILNELSVVYSKLLTIKFRLYQTEGPLGAAIEVVAEHDMTRPETTNSEMFMKIKTDIDSGNTFYTDQNGFQMIRRMFHSHLPIQANYYPASSAVFIEDKKSRLTILTTHGQGVTSPRSGILEVMIDRRIQTDDGRGMGEGLMDNKRTVSRFWFLLERRVNVAQSEVPNLSRLSHTLSSVLNYPAVILDVNNRMEHLFKPSVSFLQTPYPCDVHLINLRTLPLSDKFYLPSNSSLLILHNKNRACNVMDIATMTCDESMEVNPFRHLGVRNLHSTRLTGMGIKTPIDSDNVTVARMEIATYKLDFP